MLRIVNSNAAYRTVQFLFVGPLIVLWAGVAYWFGFSSGVILRLVFPPMAVPMFLLVFPVAGFIWTLRHFLKTPRERHSARTADVVVCLFLLFSIVIVAGQFAGQ